LPDTNHKHFFRITELFSDSTEEMRFGSTATNTATPHNAMKKRITANGTQVANFNY